METTTKRSRKKGASSTKGTLIALQFDVLDPAPDGTKLPDEALPQAVRDCTQFSMMALLESMGLACIPNRDEPVMIARHRLVLLIAETSMREVIGHMRAYADTVWAGHPVMVSVRPTLMVA